MSHALSKGRKVKSLKEVREDFHRSGLTVRAWANKNRVNPALVYEIFRGRACHRGESHKIAVLLGVKDGVIEEQCES